MSIGTLQVVSSEFVAGWLAQNRSQVLALVERAYLLHEADGTESPPSAFLRFRQKPGSRIISLPACVYSDPPRVGMKWIASNPANPSTGLPRASSVIVVNDYVTGFPIALMEGSLISAARTAASAALAAKAVAEASPGLRNGVLGVVGCGPIARTVQKYLVEVGFEPPTMLLSDTSRSRAEAYAKSSSVMSEIVDTDTAMRRSDVVVLATSATTPHIHDPVVMSRARLVLNLSLRDLAPSLLRHSDNYVDDHEHALREGTSLQLAQALAGNAPLRLGTIGAILRNEVRFETDRPVVFSPFGLGMLDVMVAGQVLNDAMAVGSVTSFNNFLPTSSIEGL